MAEVKDKDKMSDRSNKEKPFNIEERIGRIEGILEQVRERLNHLETGVENLRNHVETEIGGLRGEIGGLRGEIGNLRNHVDTGLSELRKEMDSRFAWLIGIIIIEGILILLTILFKIP